MFTQRLSTWRWAKCCIWLRISAMPLQDPRGLCWIYKNSRNETLEQIRWSAHLHFSLTALFPQLAFLQHCVRACVCVGGCVLLLLSKKHLSFFFCFQYLPDRKSDFHFNASVSFQTEEQIIKTIHCRLLQECDTPGYIFISLICFSNDLPLKRQRLWKTVWGRRPQQTAPYLSGWCNYKLKKSASISHACF